MPVSLLEAILYRREKGFLALDEFMVWSLISLEPKFSWESFNIDQLLLLLKFTENNRNFDCWSVQEIQVPVISK